MKKQDINRYIKQNWKRLSDQQLARKCRISLSGVDHRRFRMGLKRTSLPADPKEAVEFETQKARNRKERNTQKQTLKFLIAERDRLQRELEAATDLRRP